MLSANWRLNVRILLPLAVFIAISLHVYWVYVPSHGIHDIQSAPETNQSSALPQPEHVRYVKFQQLRQSGLNNQASRFKGRQPAVILTKV